MQNLGKSITDLDQLFGDGQLKLPPQNILFLGAGEDLSGEKNHSAVLRNLENLITPSHMLLDKTEPGLTLADIGAQHVNAWHLLKRSEFCGSSKPRGNF